MFTNWLNSCMFNSWVFQTHFLLLCYLWAAFFSSLEIIFKLEQKMKEKREGAHIWTQAGRNKWEEKKGAMQARGSRRKGVLGGDDEWAPPAASEPCFVSPCFARHLFNGSTCFLGPCKERTWFGHAQYQVGHAVCRVRTAWTPVSLSKSFSFDDERFHIKSEASWVLLI